MSAQRLVTLVALFASLALAAQATTDLEKAQERATRDAQKAAERAAKDSIETAKKLAKMAAEEEKHRPAQMAIPGATFKQVRSALIEAMGNNGCQPKELGDDMLIFEKPLSLTQTAIAGVLMGTPRYANATAKHRITFTIDDSEDPIVVRNTAVVLVVNEHLPTAYSDDQTQKSKPRIMEILNDTARIAMRKAVSAAKRNADAQTDSTKGGQE